MAAEKEEGHESAREVISRICVHADANKHGDRQSSAVKDRTVIALDD